MGKEEMRLLANDQSNNTAPEVSNSASNLQPEQAREVGKLKGQVEQLQNQIREAMQRETEMREALQKEQQVAAEASRNCVDLTSRLREAQANVSNVPQAHSPRNSPNSPRNSPNAANSHMAPRDKAYTQRRMDDDDDDDIFDRRAPKKSRPRCGCNVM